MAGNGADEVTTVHCQRMEPGQLGVFGRHSPREAPDLEFEIKADLVLIAYGFDPLPISEGNDLSLLEADDWMAMRVDKDQHTNIPGVFAGGDVVHGASLLVHGVRYGSKAAAGNRCSLGK